jgi:cell division protein FtsX
MLMLTRRPDKAVAGVRGSKWIRIAVVTVVTLASILIGLFYCWIYFMA